jgi:hypothetical protein
MRTVAARRFVLEEAVSDDHGGKAATASMVGVTSGRLS